MGILRVEVKRQRDIGTAGSVEGKGERNNVAQAGSVQGRQKRNQMAQQDWWKENGRDAKWPNKVSKKKS